MGYVNDIYFRIKGEDNPFHRPNVAVLCSEICYKGYYSFNAIAH